MDEKAKSKMKFNAIIVVIISTLLFILIQDEHWLLGWDFLDIIFMTILLIGIDRKWNARYFTGLFIIALFNRESALYIPLYMLIDSTMNKRYKLAVYSFVLIFIGFAAIYLLRERFISSCQPYIGLDGSNMDYIHGGSFKWFLFNISNLFYTYPPWKISFDIVPAAIIYIATMVKRDAIGIMIWIIIISIFYFGAIHEVRMYLILLPLFIYNFRERYETKYGSGHI